MVRLFSALVAAVETATTVALFLTLAAMVPLLGLLAAIVFIPDDIPLADVYYDAAYFMVNIQWTTTLMFAAGLVLTTALYFLTWVVDTVLYRVSR